MVGDPVVPNLSVPGLAMEQLLQVYSGAQVSASKKIRLAGSHADNVQDAIAWAKTWDAYARGGVVGESATLLPADLDCCIGRPAKQPEQQ